MEKQTIPVQLRVGSWVTVFESVDVDEDDEGLAGFSGSPAFEDKVEQYAPQTGLLRFEDSDIGRAEFESLLEEHDSVQVVRE